MGGAKTERVVKLPDGSLLGEWKIVMKLGEGSFGAVFRVSHIKTNDEHAMKVESTSEEDSMIKMEVAVLKTFRQSQLEHSHICKYIDSGTTSSYRYVVMKLCGPNLADVRKHCPKGKFSESTTVRLGIQCVRSLESLHKIGFIHRDVKPPNYAIGLPPHHRVVYLLDFGLARQYVDRFGRMRPPRSKVGFRGTVRYASLNAHLRKDLARHDDLWCLLYMLIEVSKGKLPWRRISEKEKVGEMKKETVADRLLEGMAPEFHAFHNELQGLQFQDTPNYEYFVGQLKAIMKRQHYREEDPYDWEMPGADYAKVRKTMLKQPYQRLKLGQKKLHKERDGHEKSRLSEHEKHHAKEG